MLAAIPSATVIGTMGHAVTVEVHVSNGIPGFTVVGLPDPAVRESRDRVRAAIISSGLTWPQRRITVNLAPSGLRKTGAGLDLPMAVGVLAATGQVPPVALLDTAFVGELGLDGSVRPVAGTIPVAHAVTCEQLVLSSSDARVADAIRQGRVRGVRTLAQVVAALRSLAPWPPPISGGPDEGPEGSTSAEADASPAAPAGPDLADVRGQRLGRRAIEVAAAGGHHLLMVGPPGSGKTMLAHRLIGLLPELSRQQSLETSRIHSAAGEPLPVDGLVRRPPFRAPHHGASAVSLIGGGTSRMRPGEISLATNGVLFLDEMGEFPASVLDALRQPLEEGVVRVSRAAASVTFPGRFQLVGAMNPCPCGEGQRSGACRCTDGARMRYVRRLSGPLLDRFDLVVPIARPAPDELVERGQGESTSTVSRRVVGARRQAAARGVVANAQLRGTALAGTVELTESARHLLERHVRSGDVSGRGLERLQRVALTLADLAQPEGTRVVEDVHLAEAIALHAGHSVMVPDGR